MTKPVTTKTTTVTTTETSVALDPEVEATIARFNEVKILLKELAAEKDKLDNELREQLAGAAVGTIGGVERLRVVLRNNSKIDREALRTAWPEAFEATLVVTPYTILQTK